MPAFVHVTKYPVPDVTKKKRKPADFRFSILIFGEQIREPSPDPLV